MDYNIISWFIKTFIKQVQCVIIGMLLHIFKNLIFKFNFLFFLKFSKEKT
jgi:hypothetical protein